MESLQVPRNPSKEPNSRSTRAGVQDLVAHDDSQAVLQREVVRPSGTARGVAAHGALNTRCLCDSGSIDGVEEVRKGIVDDDGEDVDADGSDVELENSWHSAGTDAEQ